jgi:transposase
MLHWVKPPMSWASIRVCWVELSSHGRKAFKGQANPRDEQLSSLKRELARVEKERDFLREAATYFAKESK